MTHDQGRGIALHKELGHNTGIEVYFCDPYTPGQRGSNENMNGLVRQYLPKGTGLSVYRQGQLHAIADQIQGLGVLSAMAVYKELLRDNQQHSALIR